MCVMPFTVFKGLTFTLAFCYENLWGKQQSKTAPDPALDLYSYIHRTIIANLQGPFSYKKASYKNQGLSYWFKKCLSPSLRVLSQLTGINSMTRTGLGLYIHLFFKSSKPIRPGRNIMLVLQMRKLEVQGDFKTESIASILS